MTDATFVIVKIKMVTKLERFKLQKTKEVSLYSHGYFYFLCLPKLISFLCFDSTNEIISFYL